MKFALILTPIIVGIWQFPPLWYRQAAGDEPMRLAIAHAVRSMPSRSSGICLVLS